MAECTVIKYLQVFAKLRVVLRPEDDKLSAKLSRFPVELIEANDAHLGMGHSLAAGFSDLEWRWAFVALLDMPFVATTTLELLKDHAARQLTPAIIRPRVQLEGGSTSLPGHPIGWHNSYYGELCSASGDVGAKPILLQHQQDVVDVIVTDEGVIRDIDRPEDLT